MRQLLLCGGVKIRKFGRRQNLEYINQTTYLSYNCLLSQVNFLSDCAGNILDEPEKPKGFSVVLRNKDFSKLWFGQLISNVGSSVGSLALLFYAFALTGSELAMAGLAMTQILPMVLFSGVIGVYIDRWDRKKIMIGADIVRAIATFLYPFATSFPAVVSPLNWLYILSFVYSTSNAFFFPARSASIPRLVQREDLVTANSLSQMTFQMISLIFTPLGGALMAIVAPDYFIGFLIDASTFMASGLILVTIRSSLVPEMVPDIERSYMKEMKDAFGLVRQNSVVSFLLLIFTALMLLGGMLNAIVVPFFQGELGFDEFFFSLIMSGSAVSGVIAAAILGQRAEIKKPFFLMMLAMVIIGVVMSLLSFVPMGDFIPALLLMSTVGAVNVAIGVPNAAIMQEIVEDKMRGKVFSFQSVMINTAQLTGMAIAGVWAESVSSSRQPIFIAGIGALIIGIIGFAIVVGRGMHGILWKIREERAKEKSLDTELGVESLVEEFDFVEDTRNCDD
jgi:DHA3 family macrolide efflux protein-like MFS transporter